MGSGAYAVSPSGYQNKSGGTVESSAAVFVLCAGEDGFRPDEQSVAASESRRSTAELGRTFSNLPVVLCPGWKLRQHLFEGFLVYMTT